MISFRSIASSALLIFRFDSPVDRTESAALLALELAACI